MDSLQTLIKELQLGKESTHQIRILLQQLLLGSSSCHDHHDHQGNKLFKGLDDHSLVALTTFDKALSMLKNCDFAKNTIIKRPKLGVDDSPSHRCKSENNTISTKDRRGCYKRRRNGEPMIKEISILSDDGHAWRKYGQKIILNSKHPRNYYRCTHKYDQGCQATKQVQQIHENPTKYQIIYHNKHTCKPLLKNPPIIIHPQDDHDLDSYNLLSFGVGKQVFKPFMFQSYPTSSPSSSSSSSSQPILNNTMISGPIKKENIMPSDPLSDHLNHGINNYDNIINNQYSSPSSDQSDVISSSTHELYNSSKASPHVEEDYYAYLLTDASFHLDDMDVFMTRS